MVVIFEARVACCAGIHPIIMVHRPVDHRYGIPGSCLELPREGVWVNTLANSNKASKQFLTPYTDRSIPHRAKALRL